MRRLLAPLALCVAVVAAAPVTAAPQVSITTPQDGATISRSESPSFSVEGLVEFDVPEPGSRAFYARRTACEGNQRLSTVRGSETAGCAQTVSLTPVADETASAVTYMAENGVPFTLDATRPITGVVSLVSYLLVTGNIGVGAGLTEVDVTVFGDRAQGSSLLGSTTISYMATPATYRVDTPWSITPPPALDKQDFTGLTLGLTVRGRNAMHGFTRPNDTNLTLPIWTASFDRRVEVAVGSGSFSSSGISVADEFTTWSGTRATPGVGSHFLRARAVQGGTISGVVQQVIHVTE